MKKITAGVGISFKGFEKEIEVKLASDYKPQDYFHSDYKFALFLSYSKPFTEKILKIRQELGISQALEFPKNPTSNYLVELVCTLNEKQKKLLEKRSEELIKKYGLNDDWLIPIQITVLSHILIVPQVESIKYLLPESVYKKHPNGSVHETSKEKTLIEDYELDNFYREEEYKKLKNYPVIYLTRQLKEPGELGKWIKENWSIIDKMQSILPKKRVIKGEIEKIFWGHIVWLLRQNRENSWENIADEIGKFIEKKIDKNINTDTKNIREYPDEAQLKECLRYFFRELKKTDIS